MYGDGNLLYYLKYREMGIERKIFRFKVVVISRPPGDLPYEEYFIHKID
jgi:hypothetical protein